MTQPTNPSPEPGAVSGNPGEPVVPVQPGTVPPPQPPYPEVWYPPATRSGTPPPAGPAGPDDRTWTLIAHYGGAIGMILGAATLGWVAPLVVLAVRGDRSATVRAHAAAAVNFQLTWSMIAAFGYLALCTIVGGLLTVIVVPGAGLVGIIFGILAGLRGSRGELYRYPVSIPFVK